MPEALIAFHLPDWERVFMRNSQLSWLRLHSPATFGELIICWLQSLALYLDFWIRDNDVFWIGFLTCSHSFVGYVVGSVAVPHIVNSINVLPQRKLLPGHSCASWRCRLPDLLTLQTLPRPPKQRHVARKPPHPQHAWCWATETVAH
jgi:hypothetical protein